MSKEKLTQERLKEILHYNPKTGIFINKIQRSFSAKKGKTAGAIDGQGYIVIGINYKSYLAHRLAYLYCYGFLPENGLDHIDRIRHHNWISNLREASTQCNQRNYGNRKDNKSGVKGVSFYKNKWRANIKNNQKQHNLGVYKSFDNAVCARLAAEQCLGWEYCDSNSPAFEYVKSIL